MMQRKVFGLLFSKPVYRRAFSIKANYFQAARYFSNKGVEKEEKP